MALPFLWYLAMYRYILRGAPDVSRTHTRGVGERASRLCNSRYIAKYQELFICRITYLLHIYFFILYLFEPVVKRFFCYV